MADRWVALLRGINLGTRQLRSADLKRIGEDQGYHRVSTYLASGNLLFTAEPAVPRATLSATLSAALGDHLGAPVAVVIRTAAELTAALSAARQAFAGADETRVAIAFLDHSAKPGPPDRLGHYDVEQYLIADREVYLHYPEGQGRSTLVTAVIDKALAVTSTVRGVRTVEGLIARA